MEYGWSARPVLLNGFLDIDSRDGCISDSWDDDVEIYLHSSMPLFLASANCLSTDAV